jgi:hypothetical protein
MKYLFLFFIFCDCYYSYGQNLALVKQPVDYTVPFSLSDGETVKKKHKTSTLSSVSGGSIVLGVGVYAYGYLKVQGANKNSMNSVNQSEINGGHTLETIGSVLVTAGISMILVDAIFIHSDRKSKVGVVSLRNNVIGIAYNF